MRAKLALLLLLLLPAVMRVVEEEAEAGVPLCQRPLLYGETTACSLGGPRTYHFSGGAADVVLVRMGVSTSGLDPVIRLFDPDGSLLCQAFRDNSFSGRLAAEISSCTLTADGTYTIEASELGGDETGDYGLSLQQIDSPTSLLCVGLGFGQTVGPPLEVVGETDCYTFPAAAGDVVLVRMGVNMPGLDPEIRLFDPNGSLFCEAATDNSGSFLFAAEVSSCTLTAGGTYTIVASDLNGEETGNYGLSLQQIDSPTSLCAGLGFGQTVSAILDVVGETDCYTFPAAAGDVVLVRMGVNTPGLDPEIRLFGPNGSLVVNPDFVGCEAAQDNSGSFLSAAEVSSCTLTADGTYTIVASDLDGNETGDYALTLTCLSPPCDDTDGDGFSGGDELFIGTNPLLACSTDNWPPDFPMGDPPTSDHVVNILDVFQLLPPAFGSVPGELGYSPRKDLVPDGVINILDVFKVLPPTFGSVCTP